MAAHHHGYQRIVHSRPGDASEDPILRPPCKRAIGIGSPLRPPRAATSKRPWKGAEAAELSHRLGALGQAYRVLPGHQTRRTRGGGLPIPRAGCNQRNHTFEIDLVSTVDDFGPALLGVYQHGRAVFGNRLISLEKEVAASS